MASFNYRGVHICLSPYSHGQYMAVGYYANEAPVSVIIQDMEWIDRLLFPDDYTTKQVREAKSAIYRYILNKKNNR